MSRLELGGDGGCGLTVRQTTQTTRRAPRGHVGTAGIASLPNRCATRFAPMAASSGSVCLAAATRVAVSMPPSRYSGCDCNWSRISHVYLNWLNSHDCRFNTDVYSNFHLPAAAAAAAGPPAAGDPVVPNSRRFTAWSLL